jgi:hypothetical protein
MGYSLWAKHLFLFGKQWQKIINYLHSEECTEIPDTESFSEHFCFSSSSSSDEEISTTRTKQGL